MSPKQLGRLKRRAEFLAVAGSGKKWVTPGMIVQIMPRPDFPANFGYEFALLQNEFQLALRKLARHFEEGGTS